MFVIGAVPVEPTEPPFDRPIGFVIPDDAGLGPEVFDATKTIQSTERRAGVKNVTAIAAREHGTAKYCKVLRFIFTIPDSLRESLDTWIAVSKGNKAQPLNALFGMASKERADLQHVKEKVKERLNSNCTCLTSSQKCAGWFVLRQFRVTGTNAGMLLMNDRLVLEGLGMSPSQRAGGRTCRELFEELCTPWFSSKTSTEAMMRGSVTEVPVMEALRKIASVAWLFEVGIFERSASPFLACSADGIALLDVDSFQSGSFDDDYYFYLEVKLVVPASVEIKTKVQPRSLGLALCHVSSELICCVIGDEEFQKYIPNEHIGHIIHQLLVM